MTRELSENDDRCHICQRPTDWLLHVHFAMEVHVSIALCDNHRPKAVEVVHAENEGLQHLEFDHQNLTAIHYGEKKKDWIILGPEAPGLGVRRAL